MILLSIGLLVLINLYYIKMYNIMTFNMNDGYAEALLRGLRKGIFSEQNYMALRSCTNIKDVNAAFAGTDYEDFVKNLKEEDTAKFKNDLKKKLAHEIDYLQQVSGPELQKFIQLIRHRYMIDNVITIIECNKTGSREDVIRNRMDDLGYLPEIEGLLKMKMQKIDEIYEDVLMDTEVGCYFFSFLEEQTQVHDSKHISSAQTALQLLKPEKIKNSLKKIWLENFYLYCQSQESMTRGIMMGILEFEADCQAIQVVYNSLIYDTSTQEAERKKMIPCFGKLYPVATEQMVKANSFDALKEALANYPEYFNLIKDAPDPKKLEEFDLQSGLKTLGKHNRLYKL
jgi:V-type H+-transporting ATPase subunit d